MACSSAKNSRQRLAMAADLYSPEQIEQYEQTRDDWLKRVDNLLDRVIMQHFSVERAGQFAREGFGRRLGYLKHAILRISEVYPPNAVEPTRDQVRDAEMLLQAFAINVFGAIDNLAWVWSLEKHVTHSDGSPLKPRERCFEGKNAKLLRNSLTPPIINALDNGKDWFTTIGKYRHGVAHQIPIYIPQLLNREDQENLRIINQEIDKYITYGDYNNLASLFNQKFNLGKYGSYMALTGEIAPMKIHPQMVCDVATVVNLGEILFDELFNGQ